MYYQQLSDEEILEGFREGDADIIGKYFYGYCKVGYNLFDQRYQLREKENLDFMSLAHQYALYLMEHDWKPLEDHSPNVSLRTWLINGFGAIMGQGVGLQGQSYGIPTMQGGVETIRPYVDEFIAFAKEHPELTFLVTRIGCGIAGFTDNEISPLFEKAHEVENIVLPKGW